MCAIDKCRRLHDALPAVELDWHIPERPARRWIEARDIPRTADKHRLVVHTDETARDLAVPQFLARARGICQYLVALRGIDGVVVDANQGGIDQLPERLAICLLIDRQMRA